MGSTRIVTAQWAVAAGVDRGKFDDALLEEAVTGDVHDSGL